MRILLLFFIALFAGCSQGRLPEKVVIKYTGDGPPVHFAVQELCRTISESGVEVGTDTIRSMKGLFIEFITDTGIEPEEYRIRQRGKTVRVCGGDPVGLMYGGLELNDYFRLRKNFRKIGAIDGSPYLKKRGIKFNIPLDARTPSYDDTGDAAQQNIATMWEFDFWQEFFDQMARYRYNLLTLWSLHPYPSWVKVPEYPDVALDDVCRYTGRIDSNTNMKWIGEDIWDPEKLEIIKKMTIEEKIAFWQKVFNHAEDRGIEVYIFHWNVFVHGAQGKHGITWSQSSPVTADYIRKSVKAFLLTYPNIKGIGVTAGEHINRNLTGEFATENWMWLTYGLGIMDAKAENPDIDVRFIFRRHWSDLDRIMEAFKDYDGVFETSFKYSRARMYSSTNPPWFDKMYRREVEEKGIRCWLNVRNDDLFTFRWGDPEYAKTYIKNMPYDLIPGFYWGPDGYVYGREFFSKNPREPRQTEIDKHWYNFMIWGRTSYNPELGTEFFRDQLRLRFPEADPELLYRTWRATSEVISWIDKIHFRQNDALFSPEGCFGKYGDDQGFHDIDNFIRTGAMPLQGVISIADYALNPEGQEGINPFEVAERLEDAADVLLRGAASIHTDSHIELEETTADMMALAYLGRYYAGKIRGATHTAIYRVTGTESHKTLAVEALMKAVEEWKAYARVASRYYHPQLYARTQRLDWDEILTYVKKDVEIARKAQPGEEVRVADDNVLWERDKTRI